MNYRNHELHHVVNSEDYQYAIKLDKLIEKYNPNNVNIIFPDIDSKYLTSDAKRMPTLSSDAKRMPTLSSDAKRMPTLSSDEIRNVIILHHLNICDKPFEKNSKFSVNTYTNKVKIDLIDDNGKSYQEEYNYTIY